MYIEPNTTIRLIRNCPLDTTQEHTLWFDSVEEQTAYFLSLNGVNFFKNTYQRHGRGVLRVQSIADNLYDCNYLMFKNEGFKTTSGESKWFYGFIKSVNYVNNSTSEIEYIIDDMQTWLFDYQLGECFIEREHSATDEIGENLVPEGLEIGDYVCDFSNDNFGLIPELIPLDICIATTVKLKDDNIVDSDGEIYNGIFSGVTLTHFPMTPTGVTEYKEFMSKLTAAAKSESVTSLFLLPKHIADRGAQYTNAYTAHAVNKPVNYGINRSDNLQIRNNKLFTFPFTFLYVTNLQGVGVSYPYEYFEENDIYPNTQCVFNFFGDYSPMPSVILAPLFYKGLNINYDEKIELKGYPQLAYNIDTYKAYIAQNAGRISAEAINGLIDTGVGYAKAMASPNYEGLGETMLTSFKKTISGMGALRDKMVMPNQARGGGSPLAFASFNLLNFQILYKHIRPEFVTIIDDYFTMYGYATHKVKIPNRNVRERWCYTQTNGCVVHGSVPADAMRNICKIYDRGITFWKNGAEIGQYHLDNRPV